MAKYQSAVNIWDLNKEQIARLQVGQWVRAGEGGDLGVYLGIAAGGVGSVVVSWLHNANAKRRDSNYRQYITNMRRYALGV